jgi:hypothetical protein
MVRYPVNRGGPGLILQVGEGELNITARLSRITGIIAHHRDVDFDLDRVDLSLRHGKLWQNKSP